MTTDPPKRGDIVWTDFDPQRGREQAGRRPAVVLSVDPYNRVGSLAVVCPITSRRKGFRFEVPLPEGLGVSGVVLVDHVTSLDPKERGADPVAQVPQDTMDEILARLAALVGMP